jgi:hypothetical protein
VLIGSGAKKDASLGSAFEAGVLQPTESRSELRRSGEPPASFRRFHSPAPPDRKPPHLFKR